MMKKVFLPPQLYVLLLRIWGMKSKKQLKLKLKKSNPISQKVNFLKVNKIKFHQLIKLVCTTLTGSWIKHCKKLSKKRSLKTKSSNHSLKICSTRKRLRNSNQFLLKPQPNTVRTRLHLISAKLAKLCLSSLRSGTKPTIFSTSKKIKFQTRLIRISLNMDILLASSIVPQKLIKR
jgi:hypothetical protein